MKTKMVQCVIEERLDEHPWRRQFVAWIPEQFAKRYQPIEIRMDDRWAPCLVVNAYLEVRLPEQYVRDHERDHRTQREASDI